MAGVEKLGKIKGIWPNRAVRIVEKVIRG